MIAAGFGCRKGCSGADIVELLKEASTYLPEGAVVAGLFSVADKRGEPGLYEAARALDLPLVFLDRSALRDVAAGAKTHSPRVAARFDLPSVAETAALAGAGPGACLLVPRRTSATATCAIAGMS